MVGEPKLAHTHTHPVYEQGRGTGTHTQIRINTDTCGAIALRNDGAKQADYGGLAGG